MKVLGHQRRLDRLPAKQPASRCASFFQQRFRGARLPADAADALPDESRDAGPDEADRVADQRRTRPSGAGRSADRGLARETHRGRDAGRLRALPARAGHPLFSLDNVILTPHLAAVTQESRARASVAAADEMLRILRGEQPRNLVNPEV
jgi:D-3-phosphoglycerate dehydrogenase